MTIECRPFSFAKSNTLAFYSFVLFARYVPISVSSNPFAEQTRRGCMLDKIEIRRYTRPVDTAHVLIRVRTPSGIKKISKKPSYVKTSREAYL